MKTIIPSLFVSCLFVASCANKNNEVAEAEVTDSLAIKTNALHLITSNQSIVPPIEIDPRRKNGLDTVRFDSIKSFQYYLNDVEFGPYYEFHKYWRPQPITAETQKSGFYVEGKKEGQFMFPGRGRWYMNEIVYFEDDDTVWKSMYTERWKMFPYKFLIEPFQDDQVVEVHHPRTGEMFYKGRFLNKKAVGIHEIFTAEGNKRAEINYADYTVSRFNRSGEKMNTHQLTNSWSTHL